MSSSSGFVPAELARLELLQELDISANNLTGEQQISALHIYIYIYISRIVVSSPEVVCLEQLCGKLGSFAWNKWSSEEHSFMGDILWNYLVGQESTDSCNIR